MKREILKRNGHTSNKSMQNRRWNKVMQCTAMVLVICMIGVLILPSVAAEKRNTKSETKRKTVLDCPLSVHRHTESCYKGERLICGRADFVVHTHNEKCYDSSDTLVCTLPEVEAHVHDDSCYEEEKYLGCGKEENTGHVHTGVCYLLKKGDLICIDEEHEHVDACYEWDQILMCNEKEGEGAHTHTDDCYKIDEILTCDNQAVLHTHSRSCYNENHKLICAQLEVFEHQHGSDCMVTVAEENVEKDNQASEKEAETLADNAEESKTEEAEETEESSEQTAKRAKANHLSEQTSESSEEIATETKTSSTKAAEETKVQTTETAEKTKAQTTEPAEETKTQTTEVAESEVTQDKDAISEVSVAEGRKFTYKDENTTITILVPTEVTLPKGAQLKVKPIEEGSDDYKDNLNQIREFTNKGVLDQVFYDIRFWVKGKEVEPKGGDIQVSFAFNKGVLEENENTSVQVFHFTDDGLVDIKAKEKRNANGELKKLEFTTDSFSTYAAASIAKARSSVKNFDAAGGEYTLEYLLKQYNVVAFGDVNMSIHCMGGVLIQGDFCGAGSGFADSENVTGPSYVQGNLTYSGPHGSRSNNSADLYVGSVNQNRVDSGSIVNKSKSGKVYVSDDFMDWNELEEMIQSDSDMLLKNSTKSISVSRNWEQITIDAGSNVTLNTNGYMVQINIVNTSANKDSSGKDLNPTVINMTNQYYSSIPQVKWQDGKEMQPSEDGTGTSIVFNLPNATSATLPADATPSYGHIIAPKADLTVEGGNYNGTFICKSLSSKAEGHLWPYTAPDGTLTVAKDGFVAIKRVNGAAPEDDEDGKFSFILEELKVDNGKVNWVQQQEPVANDGQRIAFSEITYNAEGTYWYKISEEQTSIKGYVLSTEQYFVKVVVEKIKSGNNITYSVKDKTYYKLKTGQKVLNGTDVNVNSLEEIDSSEVIFDNTRKESESQITVTKEWKDSKGNNINAAASDIKVQLYRYPQKKVDGQKHKVTVNIKYPAKNDEDTGIKTATAEVGEGPMTFTWGWAWILAEDGTSSCDASVVSEVICDDLESKDWSITTVDDGQGMQLSVSKSVTKDMEITIQTVGGSVSAAGQIEGASTESHWAIDYANGQLAEDGQKTLSSSNNWKATWTIGGDSGNPKKDNDTDQDYVYKVKEISNIDGYTTTYKNNDVRATDGNITIINTKNDEVEETFKATKTVNGRTPSASEQFTFILEELQNGNWKQIDSVQNNKRDIEFSALSYKTKGTHWYRISEKQEDKENYTLDKTQYLAKVEIATAAGGALYEKTKTFYTVAEGTEIAVQENRVQESGLTVVTEKQVSFANTRPADKITVEKKWEDKDGNSLQNPPVNSVDVQLKQYQLEEIEENKHHVSITVRCPNQSDITTSADVGDGELTFTWNWNVTVSGSGFLHSTTIHSGNVSSVYCDGLTSDDYTCESTENGEGMKLTVKSVTDDLHIIIHTDGGQLNGPGSISGGEITTSEQWVETSLDTSVANQTLTVQNDWKYEWTIGEGETLPMTDSNGHFYLYKVEEVTRIEGYIAKYNSANTEGIQGGSGTLVITNKEGTVLTETLSASKRVDEAVPSDEQKFNFHLEELQNGEWVLQQSVTNENANIVFEPLYYSEAGTYWYCISEDRTTADGYVKSKAQYLAKIVATAKSDGTLDTLEKQYYLVDDTENLLSGQSVDENKITEVDASAVQFDNYSSDTLMVKKNWENVSGSMSEAGADSVQVQLEQYEPEYTTVTEEEKGYTVSIQVPVPNETWSASVLSSPYIFENVKEGTPITLTLKWHGDWNSVTNTYDAPSDAKITKVNCKQMTGDDWYATTVAADGYQVKFTVLSVTKDLTISLETNKYVDEAQSYGDSMNTKKEAYTQATTVSRQEWTGEWKLSDSFSETVTLNASTNWTAKWTIGDETDGEFDLPLTDDKGHEYYYKVKEVSVIDGYEPIYSSNNSENIEKGIVGSGEFIVTNKRQAGSIPANVTFSATKTVDNQTPTKQFNFYLQELNTSSGVASWKQIQSKQNVGSVIVFDTLTYNKEEQVGIHWYRIVEEQGSDNEYIYSQNEYLAKVEVNKSVNEEGDAEYTSDVTYYTPNRDPLTGTEVDESRLTPVQESDLKFDNTAINDSQITVNKQWKDTDGKLAVPGADKVEVRLKQYQYQEAKSEQSSQKSHTEETYTVEVTLSMKPSDDSGKVHSYSDKIMVKSGASVDIAWIWKYSTHSVDDLKSNWTVTGMKNTEWNLKLEKNNPDSNKNWQENPVITIDSVTRDLNININIKDGYGDAINTEVYDKGISLTSSRAASSRTVSAKQYEWVCVNDNYATVTLNASNNWTYAWNVGGTEKDYTGYDLPSKVDESDTVGYRYEVEELTSLYGYKTTYDNNDGIGSGVMVITNTREHSLETDTELNVNKQWYGSNGQLLNSENHDHDKDEVYFTIYQKQRTETGAVFVQSSGENQSEAIDTEDKETKNEDGWELYEMIIIRSEDGWKKSLTDIPVSAIHDNNGIKSTTYYQYKIVETSVKSSVDPNEDELKDLYEISYGEPDIQTDDKNAVTKVNVTVQNTLKSVDYALPETGGKGTLPYTLVGIALMLGAAYFIIRRRRRQ